MRLFYAASGEELNPKEIKEALTTFDCKLPAEFTYKNLGGGAFNAASAFVYLGGDATICIPLGMGSHENFVERELNTANVDVLDLAAEKFYPVTECNIIVRSDNGGRVILVPAPSQAGLPEISDEHIRTIVEESISEFDVVRADTKYLKYSRPVTDLAKERGIPIVLDTGHVWSSKPEERYAILNTVLPNTDIVLCSAGALPLEAKTAKEAIDLLLDHGAQNVVVSAGGEPIHYRGQSTKAGSFEPKNFVPKDTLGAGDMFAGSLAFNHMLYPDDLAEAVKRSSTTASLHCRFFGKMWMQDNHTPEHGLNVVFNAPEATSEII